MSEGAIAAKFSGAGPGPSGWGRPLQTDRIEGLRAGWSYPVINREKVIISAKEVL